MTVFSTRPSMLYVLRLPEENCIPRFVHYLEIAHAQKHPKAALRLATWFEKQYNDTRFDGQGLLAQTLEWFENAQQSSDSGVKKTAEIKLKELRAKLPAPQTTAATVRTLPVTTSPSSAIENYEEL